jgi:Type II secretion system (T2SS), protein M subtype b
MSRVTLSARDRRTLVLGAAGIATLVFVSRGVPAWRGWVTEARAAAVEQSGELVRAEALVRAFPSIRDSLAARNARYLALAPELLAGGSVNAAGATLASLVSTAAIDAGVKLGAVQLRSREAAVADSGRHGGGSRPVFVCIRVEGDLTGDIHGISAFLLAIERGPVHLAVRDLSITQSDAVGAPDRAETLHATFAVEGLALAPTAGNTNRKGR